jgi:DNA topoisomerase-1
MSKILVIIESPGKREKIEHILGNEYKVMATVGHIMDLKPTLKSIEIENNFNPIYEMKPDRVDVVKNLKAVAKGAKDILLCSDFDREGEQISWSVAKILGLKNPKRITFKSITKNELLEAIKNPRQIDTNLVNAQQTRRILDMLVGFELSPLLHKHMGQGNLSAGRVQSVVARLIVDRENEITAFMSKGLKSFFRFKGEFLSDNKTFNSNLYDLEGNNKDHYKGSISKLDGEENAKNFLTNCIASIFKVAHVFQKKRTQAPSPPFTTSTLQQEANRKLGFSGKRAMMSAQKLYESGYITYMRTDSVNLSEEALENIKQYVIKKYGANYHRKVEYKSKSKNTQEAHEAIRPSDVNVEKVNTEENAKLGNDEIKLYSLIWKRTVASQMKPAEYDVMSIQISISKEKDYFFMTNIENLTFPGYLSVYNIANLEEDDEEEGGDEEGEKKNKNIKIPKVGDVLAVNMIKGTQDYVKPPGRYNQASLIDKLDPKNLNIGRPATYVAIIEKIIDRNYIKIGDSNGKDVDSLVLTWVGKEDKFDEQTSIITLGKEKNKYMPTYLGILVTNFLLLNFSKIMEYQFTALMEEKLDEIAAGNLVWTDVLREFYDEFHPSVEAVMGEASVKENKYTKLLGKDPKTGFDIYATIAKYGPIIKLMLDKGKPRCAPIKEPLTLDTITLEDALKLFEYPKELGKYEKKKITLNKGQYGYYLKFGEINISITKSETTTESSEKIEDSNMTTQLSEKIEDSNMTAQLSEKIEDFSMSLEEAIELIKSKEKKTLATFDDEIKTYSVYQGPFGFYINTLVKKTNKKFNVGLPKDEVIENLTLERIKEIINNKFKRTITKKTETPVEKKATKKPTAKKAIKPAIKKKTVKAAVKKKAAKKKIFISNE